MSHTGEVVQLLEVDPDLAESIPPEKLALAERSALARVDLLEPGEWRGDEDYPESQAEYGLLVLDGYLSRTVELHNREWVELLGPGDFLRPWVRFAPYSSVPVEARWTIMKPTRVAVLDHHFTRAIAQTPEIAQTLLDRVMLRSRWLAFHLAVCNLRHVESRLLVVLWHFADRWGRIGPAGVTVPVPLTHQLLAGVVGAQRPSVTTALSALRRAGLVEPQADGTWLLHGDPPAEVGQVHQRMAAL